jgi:RNA recognition motif-containing protein
MPCEYPGDCLSVFYAQEPFVNIYVSNLSFTSTDRDLRQLFEPYGTVDKVNIITEQFTGRSRGFGFVEMPNGSEAQAAIVGLQGTALAGRPLTVNEARPRAPRRETTRDRW